MKNILYITPFYPPDYAGGARLAHSVAVKIKEHFKVIVLTKRYNVDTYSSVNTDVFEEIEVNRVKNYGRTSFGKLKTVFLLCYWLVKNRKNFDLVHFVGIPNEVFILTIIGKLLGKPMVSTMELLGDDDLLFIKKSKGGNIKIDILQNHSYIAGLSEELLSVSSEVSKLKSKLIELPNAIEFDKYSEVTLNKKKQLRKELIKEETNSKLCIFCGALSKRKGVDLILGFLDSHLDFVEKNDIKFLLLGPLEDMDLKDKLEKYSKSGEIIMPGLVKPDEVIQYYQASDLFVFPSRREGFGRVALEARACGIGCFVSDIGPMKQLFQNKVDGILFKSGDQENFNTEFMNLINNTELFETIRKNSRLMFEKKYTMDDLAERHISLYNSILS